MTDDHDDDLSAAEGIINGLMLSIVIWAVIFGAWALLEIMIGG